MTTPSRTIAIAALGAATVVGVVLLVGSLGIRVPFVGFDLQIGPSPEPALGALTRETPTSAPPSPPLVNPAEPLLLARGDAMGMNEVVGYRFGERIPPPRWPPTHVDWDPESPPELLTVRPTLTNADEVGRQLTLEYPAALRAAGIGGVTHLTIHIDTQGMVDATLVHETSGYEALDGAAMNVARTMVFDPAMSRHGPVTAWLQLPVRFNVGG